MKNLIVFICFVSTFSNLQAQWSSMNSGTTLELHKVFFPNVDTGYVTTGYSLLRTYNGGNTWLLDPNAKPYDISFTSGKVGFACVWDSIMKTVDAGNSWVPVLHDKPLGYLISFINADKGFAIGTNSPSDTVFIYKTIDAGNNWTLVNSYSPGFTINAIMDFVFLSDNIGFLVIYDGPNGNIFRTQDGGLSWTPVYFPLTGIIVTELSFPSPSIGYGTSEAGGMIAKTIDGGLSWVPINTLITTDILYSISFPSVDTGFVVGGNGFSSGEVLQTNDGGSTWFVSTSMPQTMMGVHFPSSSIGYAVGSNGIIMKYDNSGVSISNYYNSIMTFNCYPNPVINELVIEMKVNKENVNFEILNSIGQIVYKGNIKEKSVVSTSNFSSGVYFIKLQDGNLVGYKKFVKN
jgi:photosystem II stability/assembly factor-like uncharacterized protein